ncbi:FHA domain-containing protein [Pseudoduganella sp. GCM10020061]|uniref:FHA domain-containing protein n=1 Tax=Pseudoduganella sp. GCM10020061 TaxID=3317345 RepID=UPI003630D65C
MHKCRHPEHPHCTHWVIQGAAACAGGHAQPAEGPGVAEAPEPHPATPALLPLVAPAAGVPRGADLALDGAPALPLTGSAASSFDLISARRAPVQAADGAPATGDRRRNLRGQPDRRAQAGEHARPTLHVSGFDPRAAGGRQALRLELRGMPLDVPPKMAMRLKSALLPPASTRHDFARTRHGEWPSAVIEFTSRGREHGQYPIEVELLAQRDGAPPRRWTCTLVVLVPRPDATLTEIHQTYLATHKNVRITADDASIARVGAHAGGGRLDIDVTARNASIAQLNLDATGKTDLALPTIAWDEELIETGVANVAHPQPAQAACLVNAAPEAGAVRHTRLFAFDECVLGRLDTLTPIADVLLAHYGERGPDAGGLTRRLSAQHAVLRRSLHGFDIEDVSRYGLLVDGVWPGKHVPVALRPGMRIELTASVRHIVTLEVTAVFAHGVVLHRADAGQAAECFIFLAPDRHPGPALPRGSAIPAIYHARGGFWHLDPGTGRETPLCDGARCDVLASLPAHTRFAATPYPELDLERPAARPHDLQTQRSRALLASV